MDNKIEHFFVLKPDGKIYWIEKDGCKLHRNLTCKMCPDWNLQSAIDNAVEVSNFDETEDALLDGHATGHGFRLEVGKIYSLQCSVEKLELMKYSGMNPPVVHSVKAIVTFSQPEREETYKHKCIYCNGTGYSNKPPLGQ